MEQDVERDIRTAQLRAADTRWRATRSVMRAERFEALARTGGLGLQELNATLGALERRTAERHLASSRIHAAYAARLRALVPDVAPVTANVVFALADAASVRSAALTLWGSDGSVAAAGSTDDRSWAAQDLEIVIGDGPASEAAVMGEALTASREALTARWPAYAVRAADIGVHSVSVVPLHIGPTSFGSLAVFDDLPPAQAIDLHALQTVADAFVGSVLPDLVVDPGGRGPGLFTGDRAHVLHNAAGKVAAEEGCDLSSALAMIRARAFTDGCASTETARRILEEGLRLGDLA